LQALVQYWQTWCALAVNTLGWIHVAEIFEVDMPTLLEFVKNLAVAIGRLTSISLCNKDKGQLTTIGEVTQTLKNYEQQVGTFRVTNLAQDYIDSVQAQLTKIRDKAVKDRDALALRCQALSDSDANKALCRVLLTQMTYAAERANQMLIDVPNWVQTQDVAEKMFQLKQDMAKTTLVEAPESAPETPKGAPEAAKGAPEAPGGAPEGAPEAPKGTPEAPKGTPEAPEGAPEAPGGAPEGAPEAPGGAPESLGGAPEAPGGAPEAPGGAPEAPGGAPEAPGGAPEAPGGAPEAPGGAPEAPGGAPEGGAKAPLKPTPAKKGVLKPPEKNFLELLKEQQAALAAKRAAAAEEAAKKKALAEI
jgi:hypothetical protein